MATKVGQACLYLHTVQIKSLLVMYTFWAKYYSFVFQSEVSSLFLCSLSAYELIIVV